MADVKPDIKPDSGQIELSVKSEDNVIKFKVGGCATRRMMMLAWWRAPYVRPLFAHSFPRVPLSGISSMHKPHPHLREHGHACCTVTLSETLSTGQADDKDCKDQRRVLQKDGQCTVPWSFHAHCSLVDDTQGLTPANVRFLFDGECVPD